MSLEHQDAAIRAGRRVGDRHVAFFDQVFRAEALLFQGRYGEASRELDRLAQAAEEQGAAKMALARLAFLHAMTGRVELFARDRESYERLTGGPARRDLAAG
jgi:hypothetical protein